MEHRRNHIVGGLSEVDVVVRVKQSFGNGGTPGDLLGTVGNHLVGVRIGRGRRTSLEDIDWKMRHETALLNLEGGGLNQSALFWRQLAEFFIGACTSPFDKAQCSNEPLGHSQSADGKIENGTLSGSAIKHVIRH